MLHLAVIWYQVPGTGTALPPELQYWYEYSIVRVHYGSYIHRYAVRRQPPSHVRVTHDGFHTSILFHYIHTHPCNTRRRLGITSKVKKVGPSIAHLRGTLAVAPTDPPPTRATNNVRTYLLSYLLYEYQVVVPCNALVCYIVWFALLACRLPLLGLACMHAWH